MVIYFGYRIPDKGVAVYRWEKGELKPLDPRLDLWSHSPSGFEWAYLGSGPAQLALALLADATDDDTVAVQLHQQFKRENLGGLPFNVWVTDRESVLLWVAEKAGDLVAEVVDFDVLEGGEHNGHAAP